MGDGLAVGFEDEVAGGEGADEHHQGGLGEVEIGEQGADGFELEAGGDEEVGFATGGEDLAVVAGDGFEGAHGGGADGDSAGGVLNLGGGGCGDIVLLVVHDVVFDAFGADGLEGADADVEGDEGMRDGGEDFGGEMQAGGGGGDGAFVGGEDGLIAFAVGGLLVTLHVMREGEVAVAIFVDGAIPGDESVAIFEDFLDGACGVAEGDLVLEFEAFAGFDHAAPEGGAVGFEAEDFAVVVGEEAGGDDAGVVEDDAVLGLEVGGEVAEEAVFDEAGGAVDDQHAGGGAVGKGGAGDEFRGQVVVEVGGEHGCWKSLAHSMAGKWAKCKGWRLVLWGGKDGEGGDGVWERSDGIWEKLRRELGIQRCVLGKRRCDWGIQRCIVEKQRRDSEIRRSVLGKRRCGLELQRCGAEKQCGVLRIQRGFFGERCRILGKQCRVLGKWRRDMVESAGVGSLGEWGVVGGPISECEA